MATRYVNYWIAALSLTVALWPSLAVAQAEKSTKSTKSKPAEDLEIKTPSAFAPFEHLVGGWNGTEIPATNRLKGSVVKHSWAWQFQKGQVMGMSVAFEGSKILSQANLSHDPKTEVFTMKTLDAAKKSATYTGKIDKSGKMLALKRTGPNALGAEETLTVRVLPENRIRYSVWLDEKKPGAVRATRSYEIGLTKAGEAFASASAVANLPKCIITGGAAGLTVSHQGKTFPVCCTGCISQFQENPDKYVKRAEALAAAEPKAGSNKMAKGKDEGEFDSLVGKSKGKTTKPGDDSDSEVDPDVEANARKWLTLARSYDRQGKKDQALSYYKRIVKECPKTEQAKTAAVRVKELESQ